jgi:hypothetical protein
MKSFALLPVAALALAAITVACLDTDAPITGPTGTPHVQESDPPPPPVEGEVIFTFTGSDFTAASEQRDCNIPGVFCVPARYFQNKELSTEWLDFVPEEPLPVDIKKQLKQEGAVCSFDENGDPVLCDVTSSAQGRIVEKNGVGDGKGLAYDVSEDGLMVTTIALDQFDGSPNPLSCFAAGGFAQCNTFDRPVIGETWVGVPDEQGNITYTRTAAAPGVFLFTGGTPYCTPYDPYCIG